MLWPRRGGRGGKGAYVTGLLLQKGLAASAGQGQVWKERGLRRLPWEPDGVP